MGTHEAEETSAHSVTQLIDRLKQHDSQAAEAIWRRYFERLLPLARARIKAMPKVVDEEDLLVSVFDRFFRAVKEDRFARLEDRNDLWQVLLMLTERAATDQYRRSQADKRGAGKVAREGDMTNLDLAQIRELADREPGPQFIAAFNDTLTQALANLSDATMREVALLRMEGHEHQEIAKRLDISLSSVERKMRVIRALWQKRFGLAPGEPA